MNENIYSGEGFGRQHCAGADFPRHRHSIGYMCVILSGGLVEAGDAGRFRAGPGDVLVHKPFEAHLDLLGVKGAELLNLPVVPGLLEGLISIGDPDAVARLAERSPVEASKAVAASFSESVGERDWPDVLAASLRRSPSFSIREWARRHGLAPETVSRGFRQAYGTTPRRYLAEARTRRAWFALSAGTQSLAEIAFDLGFADQSHMTRSLTRMTGLSPGKWRPRTSSQFKTRRP